MDLYYVFNPETGDYFNLIRDPSTKAKEWVKWDTDALEIPPETSCYGLTVQTRFTLQEIFQMEDKYKVALMGYLLPYKDGDDKHLKI